MNIEKNIIDSIKDFPSKKICIVGMMPKEFYEIITINLTENDYIYIFDTCDNLKKITAKLNVSSYQKINIIQFGISNKYFDWYGWHVLKYYHQLKKQQESFQIFSAVFYRGRHLFQYDMGTLPLVMKMISNQGFLVVYDCAWSLAKSPTMKPSVNAETASKYTKEQIHMEQIQYLLDTFIDDDFVEQKEISCLKTRVYRKGESAYF